MHILNTDPASETITEDLRHIIEQSLDDDKAENIVSIDLAGKSSFADYMVIASGRSARHLSTLADKLSERLKMAGRSVLSIEGKENADWIVADCGDVIVHLFRPESREIYNLEKMWATPMVEMAEASA